VKVPELNPQYNQKKLVKFCLIDNQLLYIVRVFVNATMYLQYNNMIIKEESWGSTRKCPNEDGEMKMK
jgi:hypothetical protein